MNCRSVGTGSPFQPPMAITDVPDAISRAAADCEPFVAADHCVCVAERSAASWALMASSLIQFPDTRDVPAAVGIVPWCGVAAVARENATVPASPAAHPAIKAAIGGCGQSTPTAPTAATAIISHDSHVGPKALRFSKFAADAAAS